MSETLSESRAEFDIDPENPLSLPPELEAGHSPLQTETNTSAVEGDDKSESSSEECLGMVNQEFHNLIHQLGPGIKDGRWASVLVEGVSGQPVGEVVGSVMRRWAQEYEQPAPDVIPIVVTGGIDRPDRDNSAQVISYLKENVERFGTGRTLILSEYIYRGNTIHELEGILLASGIHSYDIATLVGPESDVVDEKVDYYSGGSRYLGDCPVHADPVTRPQLRHAIGYEKDGLAPVPQFVGANDTEQLKFGEALQSLADELYQDLKR